MLNAHHRRLSRKSAGFNESRRYTDHNQSLTFSTVSAHCRRRLGFEPPQSIRGGHRGLRSYVRFGEAARLRLMATMGANRPLNFRATMRPPLTATSAVPIRNGCLTSIRDVAQTSQMRKKAIIARRRSERLKLGPEAEVPNWLPFNSTRPTAGRRYERSWDRVRRGGVDGGDQLASLRRNAGTTSRSP
jgi:hypothetical protein